MPTPQLNRPTPVTDAFQSVGKLTAFLGSLVATLAGYGVLTALEGNALTGLLGTIPGLVTAVTTVVQAFQVRAAARAVADEVTPLSDPAYVDADGYLVSLVPASS